MEEAKEKQNVFLSMHNPVKPLVHSEKHIEDNEILRYFLLFKVIFIKMKINFFIKLCVKC